MESQQFPVSKSLSSRKKKIKLESKQGGVAVDQEKRTTLKIEEVVNGASEMDVKREVGEEDDNARQKNKRKTPDTRTGSNPLSDEPRDLESEKKKELNGEGESEFRFKTTNSEDLVFVSLSDLRKRKLQPFFVPDPIPENEGVDPQIIEERIVTETTLTNESSKPIQSFSKGQLVFTRIINPDNGHINCWLDSEVVSVQDAENTVTVKYSLDDKTCTQTVPIRQVYKKLEPYKRFSDLEEGYFYLILSDRGFWYTARLTTKGKKYSDFLVLNEDSVISEDVLRRVARHCNLGENFTLRKKINYEDDEEQPQEEEEEDKNDKKKKKKK